MECRKFEITLISARNLEVGENSIRKVYAKISIAGNPSTKKKTPLDKKGGANPKWNFTTTCMIGRQAVEHDSVMLKIKLYCSRRPKDTCIGEVCVSLKKLFTLERTLWGRLRTLFSCTKGAGVGKTVNYRVKKGGSNLGELKFSYRFGEVVTVNQPPGLGSALASVGRWLWLITTVATGVAQQIGFPFSWEDVSGV